MVYTLLVGNKLSKSISIIVATLSIVGFFTILILVCCGYNFKLDQLVEFCANHRTSFFVTFFKIITELGSIYAFIVIALLMHIFSKHKKQCLFLECVTAVAGLFAVIVKYIVKRTRPIDFMAVSEIGYSFPSAHALLSMVFYGLIIFFVLINLKNKVLKIFLTAVLTSLILILGFSRIYLGVHYASDVLAGYFLGLSILIIAIIIFYRLFKSKNIAKIK